MKILLVDDDRILIDVLSIGLAEQNYTIDAVTDGEQGWIYGSTYNYDLIILDWLLPKLDGVSLCQRFRDRGYDTPILLLTARNGSQDKIKGLDAGADDYLCKPFDLAELTARIRALLRRVNSNPSPLLTWGDLQLDPCSCEVSYQGQPIYLTAKEYTLLELFLRHSHAVLTIEEIINSLWSSVEYPSEATVRSHLRRLRHKLKLAGLPEDPIETVQGRGYALKSLAISNAQPAAEIAPDKETRHLAALMVAWEKYRARSKEQLVTLQEIIDSAIENNCRIDELQTAIFITHKLAGNLGIFGFDRASQLARELENILQADKIDAIDLPRSKILLETLQQELNLEGASSPSICCCLSQHHPLLLIVDDDSQASGQLTHIAKERQIGTIVFNSPELARNWLAEPANEQLPSLALVKVSFADSYSPSRLEALSLIAELKLLEPSIPVIVLADRDRFEDRLQVARHGGYFYLKQPLSCQQIFSFCEQILQRSSQGKKVTIVDDDIELLQILPSLLQPWGFKVTTLNDSRQFWDVLPAVHPDLLVLDIEMPHLSGIELCKVLRSHPYWCKIPVLFLSVHTDPQLREQVFTIGADDLIYKPIIAKQLATRISNHLGRSKL